MGCLSWPFKALAVVVLALIVIGAIAYRTELREMGAPKNFLVALQ